MSQSRAQELLGKAVSSAALVLAGRYTRPASWGVYKVLSKEEATTKPYRTGNHPVRYEELRREFKHIEVVALFTERALATELATLFKNGRSVRNA